MTMPSVPNTNDVGIGLFGDGLFGSISVLLVDADEAFVERIADSLEQEYEFETITATRSTEALEYLQSEQPIDCVVSAYQMPGSDGLELLETVADEYPGISFVMFADQRSEAIASRAIQCGADDYLQKDTGETRCELLATRVQRCVTISRQRYQLTNLATATENAGHALLVTDRQGTITYANPTMTAVSGYDRTELVGETPAKLKSGEHSQEFYQTIWEAILNGEVWQGEVVNERKDGSQYYTDQTITPITDESGTINGFVSINQNITERKQPERRLRQFRNAVEHAGHAVLITDMDGTIEYVNPTFEAITGYSREEATGQTPAILNSGEHSDDFYEGLWETVLRGEVWQAEVINERKNGDRYIVDQTIAPITDTSDDGETIKGFVAINQDITDRKERERELERFRSAVTHAGHDVVITDVDGTIEYVNDAFEAISGYTATEVIGRTPAILRSGEHDEEFYEEMWETILDGEIWQGQVINERKDGSQYYIDQTIAPIIDTSDDGKTIEGFVAINRDVTRLKEYEQELQAQNERLKQYGQTVAHDLRNPLTLLEAELETLQATVNEESIDPKRIHSRCTTLAEIVEEMRTLIEDLLTMAEQGQLVLETESVSLAAISNEAWMQFETSDANIHIEDTRLDSDPNRFRELLSNLFRNALEHAGEDVELHVGPLDFDDGFFIEDDGPGIPVDERGCVFERGFTTSDDGTGFGLAIVGQIAQAHSWTVAVQEGQNGGARFEFRNSSAPDNQYTTD